MSVGAIRIRFFPPIRFIVLLFATIAGAQNFRGGINGVVTDQGGASIPGAQVEITDEATGVTQSAIASSAGEYNFPTFRSAFIRFRPHPPALKPSK